MVLSTAFSQMFGIDYPIVSAPMDLIAGGELAAAVSGAGGLGLIGGGYGDRDWLARQFDLAAGAPVGWGSSPGLWPANRSCSTSRCSMSRWR